jgi:hypothetical protein
MSVSEVKNQNRNQEYFPKKLDRRKKEKLEEKPERGYMVGDW